jgi:hypothetical protein
MRIDRSASLVIMLVVGIALTLAGCGSGGGDTAQVAPEVQKKTQDMLTNMHKNMEVQHKGEGKAAKKVR